MSRDRDELDDTAGAEGIDEAEVLPLDADGDDDLVAADGDGDDEVVAADGDGDDEVVYDLAAWSLAQRSELQTYLVAFGVAHAWVGAELSVKEADEAVADELVAAVDEERAPRLEAMEEAGEELVFELDDWDEEQRGALVAQLEAMGVPHAFEDDGSLVVPVAWEAAVEELLDEVEFPDALPVDDDDSDLELDDDVAGDGAGDPVGDTADRGPVPVDDDAPSAPGEVLSELFLAADRLLHDTGDVSGLDGLATSLGSMEGAGPPYGVDPDLWARLAVEAGLLADHLTDGEEDQAVERATVLRNLLRPFV